MCPQLIVILFSIIGIDYHNEGLQNNGFFSKQKRANPFHPQIFF